jgi:hypothetical protein
LRTYRFITPDSADIATRFVVIEYKLHFDEALVRPGRSQPPILGALHRAARAAVIAGHEHQISPDNFRWGRIIGAKIRAEGAREAARKAIREADCAEAEAWSIRMEGFGGPAQPSPSPTLGQCLNGGPGWLEVECNRCKTRASLPLDAIRRIRRSGWRP